MDVSSNEFAVTSWINGIAMPEGVSNRVKLFCFPHAGGGASVFHGFRTAVGQGTEVYPIQLPGRESRWGEPPFTSVFDLIAALSENVGALFQPPYVFFGHSMGAFIAFELARQLRREGRPGPELLVVSAARAPQVQDPDPPMRMLPDDELLKELKRFDGVTTEVLEQPEILELMLPILRADLSMCESYEYRDEPPLECPISVYAGGDDKKVRLEHLDPWRVHTLGEFKLRVFPGNHFFFLRESRAAVMRMLREELRTHAAGAGDMNEGMSQTRLEQMIANVWADVLRRPHVGIDDNFFDLGGNSLLMVQAHTKLREASISKLSVLDLFRYPTIRILARAIAEGSGEDSGFTRIGSGEAAGDHWWPAG